METTDLDSAGPAPDPRGRSPRYSATPSGAGEGAREGRGSSLASRSPPGPRAWPGQSPLPGVSGPFPRVWGLSLGGWSGLAETCDFRIREGGGPCWEASLVEPKRSRGGSLPPHPGCGCPRAGVGGARHSVPGSAPGCTLLLRPGSWVPARCPLGRARPCRARAGRPGARQWGGRAAGRSQSRALGSWMVAPGGQSRGLAKSRSPRLGARAWPAAGAGGASRCSLEARSEALSSRAHPPPLPPPPDTLSVPPLPPAPLAAPASLPPPL